MDKNIYKVGESIFIPTNRTVEQTYTQANIGDQLWQQIYKGLLTGNTYTLEEIRSYTSPSYPLEVCSVVGVEYV